MEGRCLYRWCCGTTVRPSVATSQTQHTGSQPVAEMEEENDKVRFKDMLVMDFFFLLFLFLFSLSNSCGFFQRTAALAEPQSAASFN